MSIYGFPIKESNHQFQVVHFETKLTNEQCDEIINAASKLEVMEGGIVEDESNESTNKEVRNVTVRHIDPDFEVDWLFDTMGEYIHEANATFFDFDLIGLYEGMQFLHYGDDIGGGHYDWHTDCGPGISTRKLTVVVQLTDPEEYEGCETEVMFHGIMPQERGMVTIFPSYMPHRVSELVKGQRNALVMWVNGPCFR